MAKVTKRYVSHDGEPAPRKIVITPEKKEARAAVRDKFIKPQTLPDGRTTRKVNDLSSFAGRLRDARENQEPIKRQEDIAERLNLSRAAIAQWERGQTIPQPHVIVEVAKYLKVTPEWLAFGVKNETKVIERETLDPDFVKFDEVVFDGAESPRKVGSWGAPRNWVEVELRPLSTDTLVVVQCDAVNMTPRIRSGDRVLIDMASRRPSPPGIFAHWDGYGVAINQIAIIPGETPTARVSSLDGETETYDVPASSLKIIGRIRGVWHAF